MNNIQFDKYFEETFSEVGSDIYQKYKKSIDGYKNHIIPFQLKRMKENQTVSFKNTSLQRDKFELLSKIEKLTSQNQRNEYVLENQQKKIIQLQRNVSSLEAINSQNLSLIQALKITRNELEESLNEKIQHIKQVQVDKTKLVENYEVKNNDYNILLAAFMKDKNLIAQKLNAMNQMELAILQRQKSIKEQEFYLKKQWQQYEQQKKKNPVSSKSVIPTRDLNKRSSILDEQQEGKNKKVNLRSQILTNPLKKLYKHHSNEIYDLSLNYNGNLLATCGGDRQIKLFDILNFKNGTTIQSNSAQSVFISVSLDYGGQRLIAGSTDKSIQIFNTTTGKQLHSFVGHGEKINGVTWSSTKQKCISGADDRQIKVWEIEKASNLLSLSCGKAVKTVACNAVEPIVYSGHSDGSIRIYSINQGNSPITQIKGIIDYPINGISLLSNRNQILVSSQEGTTIHLMDFKMNKSVCKYEHKDFFNTSMHADISPSETHVVSGNCDGYLYFWNKDKKNMQKRVSGHESPITSLKYHFMSANLVSCDKEGNVIIWQ